MEVQGTCRYNYSLRVTASEMRTTDRADFSDQGRKGGKSFGAKSRKRGGCGPWASRKEKQCAQVKFAPLVAQVFAAPAWRHLAESSPGPLARH